MLELNCCSSSRGAYLTVVTGRATSLGRVGRALKLRLGKLAGSPPRNSQSVSWMSPGLSNKPESRKRQNGAHRLPFGRESVHKGRWMDVRQPDPARQRKAAPPAPQPVQMHHTPNHTYRTLTYTRPYPTIASKVPRASTKEGPFSGHMTRGPHHPFLVQAPLHSA